MKPVSWLFACWFGVGLCAHAAEQISFPKTVCPNSRLQWDAPVDAGRLFIVHLYREGKQVGCTVCGEPRLPMQDIFREQRPGEYEISIQSVSKTGIISQPSSALHLLWLGFTPLG
jgi:hypothetical protein